MRTVWSAEVGADRRRDTPIVIFCVHDLHQSKLLHVIQAAYLVRGFGGKVIKTIGDAYMAMSGAPAPGKDVNDLAAAALAIRDATAPQSLGGGSVSVRIGMDVGPVIAGVIGESRFIYDVYGDTVNTASRMESNGVPNRIQITGSVTVQLDDRFLVTERGPIEIKGKGTVTTYFLEGSDPVPLDT